MRELVGREQFHEIDEHHKPGVRAAQWADREMSSDQMVADRVRSVIIRVLNVELLTDDADLMESGLIDSLGLISIIAEIEAEFGAAVPLDELDIDQFRSRERIAGFVGKAVLWDS